MRSLGADVRLVSGGYGEAEQAGLAYAASHGAVWISPYNDGQVIAGQGSIGLEIQQDLKDWNEMTWVVPIGGGGLISGIGASLFSQHTRVRLCAVQAAASPFFHGLFHSGSQEHIDDLPTLADGLSGPVEAGSITIPMVRQMVDDIILVSENEISYAIAYAWFTYGEIIEGSAATALAGVLSGKIKHRLAILIISGGNIQPEVHARIMADFPEMDSV